MKPVVGDVVLVQFPTVGSTAYKLRPAVVVASLPGPYQAWLLCGVSTQVQMVQPGWDEPIIETQAWFPGTGLRRRSVIRLSFIDAVEESAILGTIGSLPRPVTRRLRNRLSTTLAQDF